MIPNSQPSGSYQAVSFPSPLMQQQSPYQSSFIPLMSQLMTSHSYQPHSYTVVRPQINSRYKTQLCRHFQSQGVCHLGEHCSFAHGPQQIRKPHDPLPSGITQQPAQEIPKVTYSNYKTVACRFYEQGACKYGDNCTYAHGEDQRKSTDPISASSPAMTPYYNYSQMQSTPLHSFHEPAEDKELDVIHPEMPSVKESLSQIRELLDKQDFAAADERIWKLYTEGYIVDVKKYQQYQERMQKKGDARLRGL